MVMSATQWEEVSASMKQSLIIADCKGFVVDYNQSWVQLGLANGVAADFDWHGVNLLQIAELRASSGDPLALYCLSKLDDLLKGIDSFAPVQFHNHRDDEVQWLLLDVVCWKPPHDRKVKGLIVSVNDITHLHAETSPVTSDAPLKSLLPMCAVCKRIRDSQDKWNSPESYLQQHLHVEFTHDICPDCIRRLYPQYSMILNDTKNT